MKVYTIPEVQEILRCSRATVNAMIKSRVLNSPMRGRVTVSSVNKLLEEGEQWPQLAAKRAAQKATAPNGKTKAPDNGAGASEKTRKLYMAYWKRKDRRARAAMDVFKERRVGG